MCPNTQETRVHLDNILQISFELKELLALLSKLGLS